MYGGAGELTPPSPTTGAGEPTMPDSSSVGDLTDIKTPPPKTFMGTIADSLGNFGNDVTKALAPSQEQQNQNTVQEQEQAPEPEPESAPESESESVSAPESEPESESVSATLTPILAKLAESNANLAESVTSLTKDLKEANDTIAGLKEKMNPTSENTATFGLDKTPENDGTVSNGESEMSPFSDEQRNASTEDSSEIPPFSDEQGGAPSSSEFSADGNGQSSEMSTNPVAMPTTNPEDMPTTNPEDMSKMNPENMPSVQGQGQEGKNGKEEIMGGKSRQQRKRKNRRTRKFKYIYRY